jgi:hypothetical protein
MQSGGNAKNMSSVQPRPLETVLRQAIGATLKPFPHIRTRIARAYDGLNKWRTRHELDIRSLELEAELRHANYQWDRWYWRYMSVAEQLWGPPLRSRKPPSEMPPEMIAGYTMDGRVPIIQEYCDSTMPRNYPLIYTDAEINDMIARISARNWSIYGLTDCWLCEAFEKYPINGQSVAVMGSLTAWYESACIRFGGRPTTIDYNPIISKSERLKTMTVAEYEANPVVFDAAVSISSFEHDGLGQYGDPLDPEADLKTMQKMKSLIRPNGLMFLALPIGSDEMRWNSKRVYGRVRLPLLLKGWDVIDRFGYFDGIIDSNGHREPILVLRNT